MDTKDILGHSEFLNRIKNSLYYGKLPMTYCISLPLLELAAELFTEANNYTLEKLDTREANRISRNACVSPSSLILALLYIDKLKTWNPEYLHQVTPSELFLVTLLVASKYLHDDGEEGEGCNRNWAVWCDISVSQINKLEANFLAAINWRIAVQQEDFWKKLQQLEKRLAYRKAQKRGWCSYTEMCCLMDFIQLTAIAQSFVKISSVCLATYVTGLMTLLGSSLIAHSFVTRYLSLEMRQPENLQTTFTSPDLISPSLDAQSQNINNDVLPILNPSICNVITYSCTAAEITTFHDSWLNSMMIWLPNYYNALENDHADEITNCANRLLAGNYSFNSYTTNKAKKIETSQDFTSKRYYRNIKWEKILDMISTLLMTDLRSKQFYHFYQALKICY